MRYGTSPQLLIGDRKMTNVIPFNQPKSSYSMTELFLNMNRTQQNINRNMINSLELLNKRYKILKAVVIATVLISLTTALGFGLAVNKMKSMTYSVYVDGQRETVDIKDLPIAPLEELK